ncbi:MAG: hypothetical protein JWQ77_576 [Jatrophihabitans sp.]|nr:hypothetical protein [Jatrophihabitans sp.]
MAADNTPGQDTEISATASDGRVVRTTTDAAGRFTLRLGPGRYSVAAACGPPATTVVAAGQQTVLALRCDVP